MKQIILKIDDSAYSELKTNVTVRRMGGGMHGLLDEFTAKLFDAIEAGQDEKHFHFGTPEPAPQFSVDILWANGELFAARDKDQKPTKYSFNTQAELVAFLKGIHEAQGWTDYEAVKDKTP